MAASFNDRTPAVSTSHIASRKRSTAKLTLGDTDGVAVKSADVGRVWRGLCYAAAMFG
jgi:hypothetical protein